MLKIVVVMIGALVNAAFWGWVASFFFEEDIRLFAIVLVVLAASAFLMAVAMMGDDDA